MARYYLSVGAEVEVDDADTAQELGDRLAQIVNDTQLVVMAYQATEPEQMSG